MDTPNRHKRKINQSSLPSRRLFSEATSPQRQPSYLGQRPQGKYPNYPGAFSGIQIQQGNPLQKLQMNFEQEFVSQNQRQLKRRNKQYHTQQRKGLTDGMNPYHLVVDEAETYQTYSTKIHQNLQGQKISKLVLRWMKCEYFYSWIDRPFFLNNDFKQILNQLDMGTIKLNKQEWVLVRKTMAGDQKPRRFSEKFIQEEKDKLRTYRDIIREIIKSMQHKNFVPDQNGDLSLLMYDKKPQFDEEKIKEVLQLIKEYQIAPLVVGQRVLAIHPKTRELRTASLLTTDVQSYHAQFDKPELGVMVISDMHLIPISGSEYYQQHSNQSSNLQLNNLRNIYLYNKFQNMISKVRDGSQGQIVGGPALQSPFQPTQLKLDEDDMNFIPFEHTQFSKDNLKAMAILIILFERKNALIQEIRQLNDQFQKNPLYTEDFRQKYAWTAIQLQATNSIIEPVLTMFRFRSIKPEYLHLYEDQSALEKDVTKQIIDRATLLFNLQDSNQEGGIQIYQSNENELKQTFKKQINQLMEPIIEDQENSDEDQEMSNDELPEITKQGIEMSGIYQQMRDSFNLIIPSNFSFNLHQENTHQMIDQEVLKHAIEEKKKQNQIQVVEQIQKLKSLISGKENNEIVRQIQGQIEIIQEKINKMADKEVLKYQSHLQQSE